MIVRVFRFDAKSDYEFYYKPYEIDFNNNLSIKDVLNLCAKQDRYFLVDEAEFYVKIDQVVVKTDQLAFEYIKDGELKISPLSKSRAKLDFQMDKKEFNEVYRYYFAPLFDDREKALYDELEFLFYASPARKACGQFMGDSAIIFAAKMLDKYPHFQKELKSIIFSDYGIRYSQDLRPFLAKDALKFEEIKSNLKAMQ